LALIDAVEIATVFTPTADSVIRKNKNFSKNFVLSFGRKLDPVVEKNLTKAINA